MGIDRELLTQGKLDDRLFFTTSEESEDTAKDRNREDDQRLHGGQDSARIHDAERV